MASFVLLGGGGMAIELVDLFRFEKQQLLGYYDPFEDKILSQWLPWLGDERKNCRDDVQYIVAAGTIPVRKKMIAFIEENHLIAGTFISSKAYVSFLARVGKGAVIFPGAQITGNPCIGAYLFMDAMSIIGHHDVIGDNVVVGPETVITGSCHLGSNISLGANATLLPGTILDDEVEIGLGTFPKKHIRTGRIVVGKPGKTLDY